MTFSLRLTADLILALAARAIGARRDHPLILQLSIDDVPTAFGLCFPNSLRPSQTANGSSQPLAARSHNIAPRSFGSPGANRWMHPDVARFTNALAASRAAASFLRPPAPCSSRRLHEFQPSSRFYFASPLGWARNPRTICAALVPVQFAAAWKPLRMAQSGRFFHLRSSRLATTHGIRSS